MGMLRRIFEPKRGGIMGAWRKLHNEELHNLYSSSNIIRTSKSRMMRKAGHVAPMEKRNAYSRGFKLNSNTDQMDNF
jgi:hypothetical protein